MSDKIVISSNNKKAIAVMQSFREKKAKLREHFSKPGRITALKLKNQ
jgi:hypothetical protein